MGASLCRYAWLASLLALVACKDAAKPASRPTPTVSAAFLESARVDASMVHRSCTGERFCREDVVMANDRETIADLDESCERHGGTPASTRCVRDGAIASCSVNGTGLGAITVFAYQDGAASTVAEQCDAFEGTFERLAPATVAGTHTRTR